MSLALVYARASLGIDAPLVTVEVHLSNGLPSLSIVGLPETAVRESKDRVRSAIINSHLEFPARRITINLAPADLPKEGGRFDLAIALGILAASEQIPASELHQFECVGELALSGALRAVTAVLSAGLACGLAGRQLIVPQANSQEAGLCSGTTIYQANNLLSVCAHFHKRQTLPLCEEPTNEACVHPHNLSEVKGQEQAKRALTVAAAGQHNLLFYGPPGTGKTMLAQCLPSILPSLSTEQALEVAAIHSMAGFEGLRATCLPPFRSPHHTATAPAMVGGGARANPGEVSLAHHGVLFLDEFPEFQRRVLEVMREPLESGSVVISRANYKTRYPSNFQLIAAMNPCPCGYQGDVAKNCRCSPDQIRRYQDKISGPLLDRIDLQVQLMPLHRGELYDAATGASSAETRGQVELARRCQYKRQGLVNSQLDKALLEEHCLLTSGQLELLENAANKLGLSARAQHRVMKVARTLADLEGVKRISNPHLIEALGYRGLDCQSRY